MSTLKIAKRAIALVEISKSDSLRTITICKQLTLQCGVGVRVLVIASPVIDPSKCLCRIHILLVLSETSLDRLSWRRSLTNQ